MNKSVEVRTCVRIGGKYYHDARQAAKAWAFCAANSVWCNYEKHDEERYQKRFKLKVFMVHSTGHVSYNFTENGAQLFWDWKKFLEKKAYRRAVKHFKKFFKDHNND